MTEPRPPWYKRNLLPAWIPGWLAVALLIAAGFAVFFPFGLDDFSRVTIAVSAAFGFAFAMIILVLVSGRTRDGTPSSFTVPAVVRYPVMTALFAFCPLTWVLDRKVKLSTRSGTLFTGDPAAACGFVVLVGLAGLIGLVAVKEWRRRGRVWIATGASLAVILAALGIAVLRLVQRHG